MEQLLDIIEEELEKHGIGAESWRAAAWYAIDDVPGVTSSMFGDAAAQLGYHRQGAMNRFNEALKNWKIANA
jgi:hypothetical protein